MSFLDSLSSGDFLSSLGSRSSVDLAIDLGTANTLVAIPGEGIVINEPSVVAIEKSTHRVLAVGTEAKNMINHTPDAFSAEHPLKDGVIADYDVTEAMLSAFIDRAISRKYPWQAKPRIVICIPCGATSVEKRAVFEAAIQAGARQAYLVEEPMAAAIGAGLPIAEPTGNLVVDIGGGTSEVAGISLGGMGRRSSRDRAYRLHGCGHRRRHHGSCRYLVGRYRNVVFASLGGQPHGRSGGELPARLAGNQNR